MDAEYFNHAHKQLGLSSKQFRYSAFSALTMLVGTWVAGSVSGL